MESPPTLDRVAASMYVSEIGDLLDSLQFRIQYLRGARDAWLEHQNAANAQAKAPPDTFDQQTFVEALNAGGQQQTSVFDAFEALLAAWARLSLFVHSIGGADDLAVWRAERGKRLRELLQRSPDTLLSSRTFRDSWMHFDERMDRAVVEGWLGNRQQFVATDGVVNAVKQSVRVIDIEGLAFYLSNARRAPRTRDDRPDG